MAIAPPQRPSRPPTPPTQPAPSRTEASVSATAPTIRKAGERKSPPRIIINAVECFGKTTIGAYAPKPIFLCSRGETGLDTLVSSGLAPAVDCQECSTWAETLAAAQSLVTSDYETVVLDALGGFERLNHEEVCRAEYGGDWGEKGFTSYQRGYEVSIGPWIKLLQVLDTIRMKTGATILLLSHSKITNFKNPIGPDFDRYAADCHHKTWGICHKWADAVLFGKFRTVVDKVDTKGKRGKGIGGATRELYSEHCDAWDAKSRYRMPAEIEMPTDPALMWDTIHKAIKGELTNA